MRLRDQCFTKGSFRTWDSRNKKPSGLRLLATQWPPLLCRYGTWLILYD